MATTTSAAEVEINSKNNNTNAPIELYAKLIEAIKSMNKGDEVNALKAMLSISRSLG